MEKLKILLPILAATMILGACGETTITEVPSGENRFNGINADYINIITDSETGCKYIYVEDSLGSSRTTAMSPLMKEDGTADCSK